MHAVRMMEQLAAGPTRDLPHGATARPRQGRARFLRHRLARCRTTRDRDCKCAGLDTCGLAGCLIACRALVTRHSAVLPHASTELLSRGLAYRDRRLADFRAVRGREHPACEAAVGFDRGLVSRLTLFAMFSLLAMACRRQG